MTRTKSSPKVRARILQAYENVVKAILNHPSWDPAKPDKKLWSLWDFAKRSAYLLSEYDAIVAGRPLQYPDQFRPLPGKGEAAAEEVVFDLVGRAEMLKMLVEDDAGTKVVAMTGLATNFPMGEEVKQAVQALCEACRT